MAEPDKIEDLEQLEAWLRTQDVRISRAIATRAALRALPVLMAHRVQIASKTRGASLLLSRLRATLISGVASTCSLDMKRMQNSAHAAVAPYAEDSPASATVAFASSAKFSASDAASTVYTSARTALSYSNALSVSARSAAFSDADRGRDGGGVHQIFTAPLWPNSDGIVPLIKMWADFEARPDPTGIWSFWRDWYRSMLLGRPMDWELQLQVALIDDAIWEAGPEAIAKDIARIQAQMLSERLPMAEIIELNPDTGKYRAVPIPVENPATFSALLSQIGDALEDCLGGHNGLAERSGNVKKLNRVLTKYKDDPQNAELTLTRVAGSLRSQLKETQDLPDNEDNRALLNALEEGVRGIRANHPEVAENRVKLAQQALKALSSEDKQLLEEARPVLAAISEPKLADDFETDIPELINDAILPLPNGAPPLPGADATTRIFRRVSKMAVVTETGGKIFDSKEVKTARLAHLGYTVLDLLYAVVQIGLRILGVL